MVLSSSDIQHNSTIVGTYYVSDLLLSMGSMCVQGRQNQRLTS